MGLGSRDPGWGELVIYPILIILALPLLPIVWIAIILYGIGGLLGRDKTTVRDCLENTGEALGFAIVGPFAALFYLLFALIARMLGPIFEILINLRRNLPTVSIFRRKRRVFDIQDGYDSLERLQLFNKPYEYQPLASEYRIRLLVIHPGPFKAPIRGEIVTANLLWRPAYDALSYTWADEFGDTNRSKYIRCMNDGSIIYITRNCEAAIRRLRDHKKKRRVWIDAICINQDSDVERSHQVSLMSRIYVSARNVIVYTGESTPQTDLLFDWLNSLDRSELNLSSIETFIDIDETGLGILKGLARFWNCLGATKVWINDVASWVERFWIAMLSRISRSPKREPVEKIQLFEAEIAELVENYFLRRWFKRVWVLQEVALPNLSKTSVVCGTRSTSNERAMHLLNLLQGQGVGSMGRIFLLIRKRKQGLKKSYLLDILIETQDRKCSDPRDKIFGVLSIAQGMDRSRYPELEADYEMATNTVYANFSTFFICQHGPGFFLALIKSKPAVKELPSWAADWTVPWPNYKAVQGTDFAAASRMVKVVDNGARFKHERGRQVMELDRPRVLRGYFTRNGHVDGENETVVENAECLSGNELLIEMYPGLAALLKKVEDDEYVFIRVCPHALSETGVQKLVEMWTRVVMNGEGLDEQRGEDEDSVEYLSSPETFAIR